MGSGAVVSAVARVTQEHLLPRVFAFCEFMAGITYAVTKEVGKEAGKVERSYL